MQIFSLKNAVAPMSLSLSVYLSNVIICTVGRNILTDHYHRTYEIPSLCLYCKNATFHILLSNCFPLRHEYDLQTIWFFQRRNDCRHIDILYPNFVLKRQIEGIAQSFYHFYFPPSAFQKGGITHLN